jgi:hypothetical protein
LDQPWDFVFRRELEQQVNVIRHDADFNHARTVAFGLGQKKRQ